MWTGVCTDKNALGLLCMLVAIGVIWRWTTSDPISRGARRNQSYFALTILASMILYLMSVIDSKTALMCSVAACVLTLCRPLVRRPAIVSCYIIGSVAACYAVLIMGFGSGALEAIGRNSSLTGRTEIWERVLDHAGNPWTGVGYENFWLGERLRVLEQWGGNQAHNGYLEIYLNLGWIGIAILSVLVFATYRKVLSGLRTNADMGRIRGAFFLICLIYNFSEATFRMMSPVWLTFLWATMAPLKGPAVEAAPGRRVRLRSRYALPLEEPALNQKT
jgi:O-antigen ligase